MKNKKFFESAIFVCFILFVIVFLFFYPPTTLGGNTQYEPVNSGSMEPTIGLGSMVLIKPVDPESLEVGEIISFKSSETSITVHRIIEFNDEGFLTKGDANEFPDQKILKKQDVLGKVELSIPFMGYVAHFVRNPIGLIILIVLPAAIIIGYEIKNIFYELKKEKLEKKPQVIPPKEQLKPKNKIHQTKTIIKKLNFLSVSTLLKIILIAGGLITLLYTSLVIVGHEQILSTPNLPIEEFWQFQGAIQWWRKTYATISLPLSITMILSGLVIIIAPKLYKVLKQKINAYSNSNHSQKKTM